MATSRLIEEVRRASPELVTSNEAARQAVEAVTTAIANAAGAGETVTIRGFGTFKVKRRAARDARNPRTGEPIRVAARDVLHFKPSKQD